MLVVRLSYGAMPPWGGTLLITPQELPDVDAWAVVMCALLDTIANNGLRNEK
jgi:hypothetical protein